jgi:S-adenosylmethionine synthetase
MIATSLDISALPDPVLRPVEMVERKGLGHPDTICDALAEAFSRALCGFYRERFGLVLHHNVDKVLLWGGASRPAFGGGEVLAPVEIFLSGRATQSYKGVDIPVLELAVESTRAWIGRHLRYLDPQRDLRVHCLVRPGSADLVDLFARQAEAGEPLANDTSIGVGFAPLSALEQTVLAAERALNAPETKRRHKVLGEDVKVMGSRRGEHVELTVSCAMVDRHVANLVDYEAAKVDAASIVTDVATRLGGWTPGIMVNAADDPAGGSLFLTATGTSAEAGDDGEAGRGNRVNGLITPHRPMTMESVAGKNPVTHVGKLYNVLAQDIARQVCRRIDGVRAAECYVVSRIGHPIRTPQLVQLRVCDRAGRPPQNLEGSVCGIVEECLDGILTLWRSAVDAETFVP